MAKPQYGSHHQKLRASYAPLVATGNVVCWRCGKFIEPGSPWDLGHADGDPLRYAGPEHARCNRATAALSVRKTSRDW